MSRVFVARILAPHGLKGGMKVRVEDENPSRFTKGRRLYIDDTQKQVTVKSYRSKGLQGILQVEEISDIQEVEALVPVDLTVEESELPSLDDNTFYIKDLMQCQVFDAEHTLRGEVTDVLSYASNDVYVVKAPSGKEYYIPAVHAVIEKVSLGERKIILRSMKGLFDED